MVMSKSAVLELANDVLIPGWQAERNRLELVDKWGRFSPEPVRTPPNASQEQKALAEISEQPWLSLVVTTLVQQLVAELVRSSQVTNVDAIWAPWLKNKMGQRQQGIYRAACMYGYAFSTVMPGDNGSVIRGRSPRDMYAVYQDPTEDEYPMYYLLTQGNRYRVVDEDTSHELVMQDGRLQYVEPRTHGVGVAPAVRYANQMDLEGRMPGEVEPYISAAKRVNKTAFDRMLIQHFNSWKVRTATNLDMPSDPTERERVKLLLRQSDILTGEEGVEFGTLDETSVEPMVRAWESDVEALAAFSQTPAHNLFKMINLSADAITEARAMLDLKAGERKVTFGASNADTLRLASHVEGRKRDADDFTLTVEWADLGSRSLSQAADALGKLSSQLGIPSEKLWDRIPSVTAEEAAAWLKYKKENPSAEEQLAASLNAQSNGSNG